MRLVVEITGASGKSFPLTLVNNFAFLARGTWMCPPGFLLVYSGYYRVYNGNVTLTDNDPGYLLGNRENANFVISLRNFNAKVGSTGRADILDRGPLGLLVFKNEGDSISTPALANLIASWKVTEASGFEQTFEITVGPHTWKMTGDRLNLKEQS